jgi:hypothetical protein
MLSRWLTGAFAILCILATFVPWTPAFAIQKTLSHVPGSGSAIEISFHPESAPRAPAITAAGSFQPVFLPMEISGLAGDYALHADRTEVHVTDLTGRVYNFANAAALRAQGDPANSVRSANQMLGVPSDLYSRIDGQTVRLDIVYSLTSFKLAASHSLSALNLNTHLSDAGWCRTRLNANQTAIQLACEQAGRVPGCVALQLQNASDGRSNPEIFNCELSDYGPILNWQIVPDGMAHSGALLPFREPNGLFKYPVGGSKLGEAQVVMRIYDPVDHFQRTVAIPRIKLSEWQGAPYGAGEATVRLN